MGDSAGAAFGLPLGKEKQHVGNDWGALKMAKREGNGGGPFEIAMIVVMASAAIGIILIAATGFA
ncbi:hypothetical protein C7I87_03460 [Mesorhizobium sp. SARCC-RB16n]|nr:hypothetical protein C7I87_03460 [Mesorhizobium sp. SARCC-RB16n]